MTEATKPPLDWARINKYCELTGETKESTRHKQRSWWVEGVHYRKGADGKIWYHLANINQWLSTATPENPRGSV